MEHRLNVTRMRIAGCKILTPSQRKDTDHDDTHKEKLARLSGIERGHDGHRQTRLTRAQGGGANMMTVLAKFLASRVLVGLL